ncbi:MAG TPA: GNAT family N-acetyltransferase [Magnetospirillaceae bacterium]
MSSRSARQEPAAPAAVAVRDATHDDIETIQSIYAHYVLRTTASFEEVPPSATQIRARFDAVRSQNLPYLVAEIEGEVLGYCYAHPFRPRSAYRYTIENSVYVAPFVVRQGIGVALMAELIKRCTALDYRQMIAVIGDSANLSSINLHRRMGFRQEGVLRGVGLKFGRWMDVVIMHRSLGDANAAPPHGDNPGPMSGVGSASNDGA